MDIKLEKTETQEFSNDGKEFSAIYRVMENGREFRIICKTCPYPEGSSVTLAEKEGLLFIDTRDNQVHCQVIAPGGGCGLRIEDEVVEGLSASALQGVLDAYGQFGVK